MSTSYGKNVYQIVKHWLTADGTQHKQIVAQGLSLKTALTARGAMAATDLGGAGVQWVAYGVATTGGMQ